MIDLFGMRQKDSQDQPPAPASPAAAEASAEPHAPRGSHRLWAFLLVLDSIFVIVFGGAVAAKAYQYWRAPAIVVAPPAHHRPVKPPEAPPAPAVKPPEPAKPAETAKAPPPKPEPVKTAKGADSPRPPKPSMLTEPPKPHAAPAPVGTAAAPAPRPAAAAPTSADGKAKALPVVFKIRSPKAGSVQLIGAFIVHGGRKEMAKDGDGVWSVKLYLNPGQYRYFFSVDKKKVLDPENPQSDRGASLLSVP